VEISQIQYFLALCGELNFTRAARRCRVSQPSLSNGIKALERELGGQLFERSRKALTPLGTRVRPHLENAISSIARAHQTAGNFQRRRVRRLQAAARASPSFVTAEPSAFDLHGKSEYVAGPQVPASDRHRNA
jgi:DNA-binding transcriptional LysR family regulator